jgi:hypothetical protein
MVGRCDAGTDGGVFAAAAVQGSLAASVSARIGIVSERR